MWQRPRRWGTFMARLRDGVGQHAVSVLLEPPKLRQIYLMEDSILPARWGEVARAVSVLTVGSAAQQCALLPLASMLLALPCGSPIVKGWSHRCWRCTSISGSFEGQGMRTALYTTPSQSC
jgi:hypothetical protein